MRDGQRRRHAGLVQVVAITQHFLDLIEPIIQEGIDQGEFRSIDANAVAVALGAMFEGTILFLIYFPDTTDIQKQFRFNFHLAMEGLLQNI